MMTALREMLLGPRDALDIGISPETFRSQRLLQPLETELDRYSANPRNRYGEWYEEVAGRSIDQAAASCGLSTRTRQRLDYESPVYASEKVVDKIVVYPDGRRLGLELKYLHGDGSLVKPKALVDAIDFTSRPIDCLYVIDGPGWLASRNVEYLGRWWTFTSTLSIEPTLRRFADLGRSPSVRVTP